MDRKLASVQEIKRLISIPNADNIVEATVMGWSVVVKKDEFKVGDKCVFFEVDSVLPDGAEWAEFMRPRKFRVKTCKLRGVLSQGLALPLDILPEECAGYMGPHGHVGPQIGDDVSEELGVKKYEPPIHDGGAKMGCASGAFPSFVRKTDEIRIQSALGVLQEIQGVPFYVSIKCDGTSGTFVHDDEEFYVCSRNFKKKEDETNVYWQVVRKYDLQEKLKNNPFFAVQGEICGPGLQKNPLMLTEIDLFVFNVFDVKAGRYLDFDKFIEFCNTHSLQTVPIEMIVNDNIKDFDHSLDAWLDRAKGKYEGTSRNREGLVVRPLFETYSPTLRGRMSFKVINNDFLLKDEK